MTATQRSTEPTAGSRGKVPEDEQMLSQAPRGSHAIVDGLVVAKRNLLKIRRVPDVLVGTLVAPIMFIVLFRYVFGGAIGGSLPGGVPYAEFLIPGIFAQTVVFGATTTGSGLADDMQKGIIDRFRSLPMSRMAVLVGRTTSDLLTNVIVVVIMTVTGLLVGWRIHSSPLEALAAFALFLLFAYALSWVMAFVGLIIRSPEAFNQLSFLVIFPITFIADTFASSATFPAPLRVFAEWNPITSLVRAGRELFGNTGDAPAPTGSFPVEHPLLYTLVWVAAILVVFVPLATRQFQRSTSR